MPSSNPAFSRFGGTGNGQQQYAGWGNQPQQYGAPGQYGAPAPHRVRQRGQRTAPRHH